MNDSSKSTAGRRSSVLSWMAFAAAYGAILIIISLAPLKHVHDANGPESIRLAAIDNPKGR